MDWSGGVSYGPHSWFLRPPAGSAIGSEGKLYTLDRNWRATSEFNYWEQYIESCSWPSDSWTHCRFKIYCDSNFPVCPVWMVFYLVTVRGFDVGKAFPLFCGHAQCMIYWIYQFWIIVQPPVPPCWRLSVVRISHEPVMNQSHRVIWIYCQNKQQNGKLMGLTRAYVRCFEYWLRSRAPPNR